MKKLATFLCIAISLSTCQSSIIPDETAVRNHLFSETTEAFDQRMSWWRDAAFGLFIHWGLYAIPAGKHLGKTIEGLGEWIMANGPITVEQYEKYADQFKPNKFNAKEWVQIAKAAGVKYIVVTSKHHDGFCLWDSKVTTWDIADATTFPKDILAELRAACRAADIRFGLYYSIMDWHHPDAQAPHYPHYNSKKKKNPNFSRYYEQYVKPQVVELICQYQPDIMWYDGEWIPEFTHEMGLELYELNRSLNQDIIVNNRVDKMRQQATRHKPFYAGDFGTPEQEIQKIGTSFDWESCMTINDTWGFKSDDHNWKPPQTLVHQLVETAAKGGNYLLNVGPTAAGLIPAPSVERLLQVGQWLAVNEEAIYATKAGPANLQTASIKLTSSSDEEYLYAIVLNWPGKRLSLGRIPIPPDATIKLLGFTPDLNWHTNNDKLIIELPDILQDATNRPCLYAWTFRIETTAVGASIDYG